MNMSAAEIQEDASKPSKYSDDMGSVQWRKIYVGQSSKVRGTKRLVQKGSVWFSSVSFGQVSTI